MSTLPDLRSIPRQSDEDYQRVLAALNPGDTFGIVTQHHEGKCLIYSVGEADHDSYHDWSNGTNLARRIRPESAFHIAVIEKAPLPIPDDCQAVILNSSGSCDLYLRDGDNNWYHPGGGTSYTSLWSLQRFGRVIPVTLPEGVEL